MRPGPRFATDATLGKLGRHLRSAGFDTLCQHQHRDADLFETIDDARIILTRTRRLRSRFRNRPLVFIRDNEPLQQMKQVVRELNLEWGDAKLFSRCIVCNQTVKRVDREAVRGLVPAYVWHCHLAFHACAKCGRIYWAGSHHDRLGKTLSTIFQQKDEKSHDH